MKTKHKALPLDAPYLTDLSNNGDVRGDVAHILRDGRRLRLVNVAAFAFGENGSDEFMASKLNSWVDIMIDGGTPATVENNREAHDGVGGGDCCIIDIIVGDNHEFILTCVAF